MIQPIQFPISNGVHTVPVRNGAVGAHRCFIATTESATSGLITVEWQEIGSSQWYPLAKASGIPITPDGMFFYVEGAVGRFRITLSGATDAGYGVLWLSTSDIPSGAFTGDRAIIFQPYDAANIKRGLQFELPYLINPLATGTSKFILAEIGEKDIIIKNRSIDVNGGIEYRPWRGATYTKGDLIDRVENLNGRSATVNTTKFYEVSNVSLAGAESYDVVKSTNDVGSNRGLGQFPEGIERVVPAGSTVILEFRNMQSQDVWVVFKTTWYEGPTDLDPIEPK